ncbi:MAG TPA: HAMP domain-containing sensor histidine kinase, partial [Ktedonobacteraceae bacterium]|nr:HAMP domain-containing sensor histidine kinase [Ktedonobacteraceae bacterium]
DMLKDQFIVTASHELRTPLTAVQGYIDLLQSYDDRLTPQARADFIAKAGRGCDELTLMVNNIMDASRVQEEAVEVELSPITLAEPVAQVMEMMEAIVTRENRQVSVSIAEDIVVKAEEQRLKQIILNLVGNALKYSPPGTPLEISACPDDGSSAEQAVCTLRVRDYGSGVPLEEQQRLFERFVRLERDMNSPVRGAGLGLFICKQLAEAMGGSIWVESTGVEGEGSSFYVAFKLHHPAQMPVR